jgi:hypothetical protein
MSRARLLTQRQRVSKLGGCLQPGFQAVALIMHALEIEVMIHMTTCTVREDIIRLIEEVKIARERARGAGFEAGVRDVIWKILIIGQLHTVQRINSNNGSNFRNCSDNEYAESTTGTQSPNHRGCNA